MISAGGRQLALAAMAVSLLGCGVSGDELDSPDSAVLPPALLVLPMPPGYPGELAAVQQIRASHETESYDFEAYLQVGSADVAIVLALPFGPRLATIDWSANGIETRRDPDLPITGLPLADLLRPENVLGDIVLAFWPEAVVRVSLAPAVTLAVEPDARKLSYRSRPAATVRYDGSDPWGGDTVVVNHLLGYRLAISSRRLPGA